MLAPQSVLITGANRGIGLEIVKQFLRLPDPPQHIFAGCRNPDNAEILQDLAKRNPSVHVLQLDVTDQSSIETAMLEVQAVVKDEGLNLLINNAGIFITTELGKITREEMRTCFEVNATGPLMMAQTFLPLLKRAAMKQPEEQMSCNKAAIINISTDSASITINTGDYIPYRASKCAMNMIGSCLSVELKADDILCANVHPGFVETDMVLKEGLVAEINTEESVRCVFSILEKLKGQGETGKFYDATTGNEFGW